MLTISSGKYKEYELKADQHGSSCLVTLDGLSVFLKLVNPKEASSIVRVNLSSGAVDDFYLSAETVVTEPYLSVPQAHEFEVLAEDNSVDKAYGYYYPPKVYRKGQMFIFVTL